MPLFVKAPGKLVLFGEYAVLHGAPAVVTSVDRGIRVQIAPRNAGSHLTMTHLGIAPTPIASLRQNGVPAADALFPDADRQVQAVLDIIDAFERQVDFGRAAPPPVDIGVDARDLYQRGLKMGLGSSAALTVALLAGLHAHTRGKRPDRQALFNHAFRVHRYLQGNRGSGVDVAASVYGGTLRYRLPDDRIETTPEIRALAWPETLHGSTVWIGKSASTARSLSDLDRYRNRRADGYWSAMRPLMQAAREGSQMLADGNARGFMDAVDDYYRLLEDLTLRSRATIITADDGRLAAIARDHDAVYKPSGAGGGDVGLFFADDEDKLEHTRRATAKAGYQMLDVKWGARGVTL